MKNRNTNIAMVDLGDSNWTLAHGPINLFTLFAREAAANVLHTNMYVCLPDEQSYMGHMEVRTVMGDLCYLTIELDFTGPKLSRIFCQINFCDTLSNIEIDISRHGDALARLRHFIHRGLGPNVLHAVMTDMGVV